jgi:hypothetical protein
MLFLLYLLILAACVGFLFAEGMWSNAVRLVNVVFAALLAMNYFEPMAAWLAGMAPGFTYFADFIALWVLFILAAVLLNEITNRVSTVQVKFLKLADRIGSGFFAAWIGWVMVCFTMVSLHVAPLARAPLRGSLQPEERASGTAPEMLWLGFVQQASLGAFARSPAQGEPVDRYAFDRSGQFLPRYATRRSRLESHAEQTGTLRIRSDQWAQHY